jgi:hypothetical protein
VITAQNEYLSLMAAPRVPQPRGRAKGRSNKLI